MVMRQFLVLLLLLIVAPVLDAFATRGSPSARKEAKAVHGSPGPSCPLASHPRSHKKQASLLLAKGSKGTAPGDIIETYKYSGCHLLKNSEKKVKPDGGPSKRTMTIHKCFTACKKNEGKYFTLKKGDECHCLSYVDKDELKTDDSRCDQPCAGDATGDEMCGGIQNDSVYVKISCEEQEPTEAEKVAAKQQEEALAGAK